MTSPLIQYCNTWHPSGVIPCSSCAASAVRHVSQLPMRGLEGGPGQRDKQNVHCILSRVLPKSVAHCDLKISFSVIDSEKVSLILNDSSRINPIHTGFFGLNPTDWRLLLAASELWSIFLTITERIEVKTSKLRSFYIIDNEAIQATVLITSQDNTSYKILRLIKIRFKSHTIC